MAVDPVQELIDRRLKERYGTLHQYRQGDDLYADRALEERRERLIKWLMDFWTSGHSKGKEQKSGTVTAIRRVIQYRIKKVGFGYHIMLLRPP